jgi:hypothetical protein
MTTGTGGRTVDTANKIYIIQMQACPVEKKAALRRVNNDILIIYCLLCITQRQKPLFTSQKLYNFYPWWILKNLQWRHFHLPSLYFRSSCHTGTFCRRLRYDDVNKHAIFYSSDWVNRTTNQNPNPTTFVRRNPMSVCHSFIQAR